MHKKRYDPVVYCLASSSNDDIKHLWQFAKNRADVSFEETPYVPVSTQVCDTVSEHQYVFPNVILKGTEESTTELIGGIQQLVCRFNGSDGKLRFIFYPDYTCRIDVTIDLKDGAYFYHNGEPRYLRQDEEFTWADGDKIEIIHKHAFSEMFLVDTESKAFTTCFQLTHMSDTVTLKAENGFWYPYLTYDEDDKRPLDSLFVYKNLASKHLQHLEPDTVKRLQALAQTIVNETDTDTIKCRKIEQWIYFNFQYTLTYDEHEKYLPTTAGSLVGCCRHFAAVMIVMLSGLNITATVLHWRSQLATTYTNGEAIGHAECLAYCADAKRWLVFDPTHAATTIVGETYVNLTEETLVPLDLFSVGTNIKPEQLTELTVMASVGCYVPEAAAPVFRAVFSKCQTNNADEILERV